MQVLRFLGATLFQFLAPFAVVWLVGFVALELRLIAFPLALVCHDAFAQGLDVQLSLMEEDDWETWDDA